MNSIPESLIVAIHAHPTQLVYEFAGAGSLALWWLHSVAGSSRTILEASDRYSLQSLVELIGEPPQAAVSAATAQRMAACAYQRAQHLSSGGVPLLGVACTAAIATNRQRRGADHAFVGIATAQGERVYHLEMVKGEGDRIAQEHMVSRFIIEIIYTTIHA